MSAPSEQSTAALLLLDLQRDYLELPGLEPGADEVVARASVLLEGFRVRALPVIHVWTTVARDTDRRMRHWKSKGMWRCVEGTEGHRPARGLEALAGEPVVHKSGFDAFAGGELELLLEELGVQRLAIAGIHLHACVREAALGAHAMEQLQEIWVAEDAVTSDDPVHAAATRRYLQAREVDFLSSSDLLGRLGRQDTRSSSTDGAERVREAAEGSRAAAHAWRRLDARSRARALEQAADLLEPQAQGLALAMAEDIGKPIRYGEQEVRRSAEMLRAIAGRCAAAPASESAGAAEVRRRPLGVVAVITPWNNPVYIPLSKIAAALAYGNGVVWKPAPAAVKISLRVAEIMSDSGIPEQLLALVSGGRTEARLAMSAPAVDAVTVTGSSLAGFAAQEICAGRRIPLQAELGGNNAALVWSDADLELAAREIAVGAFLLAGQRCTANRRVVVHASVHAELLERLTRETAALEWGDPRELITQVGPMLGIPQRDRLTEAVARSGLSSVVPHGRTEIDGVPGAWYPPTILCCEDPAHELVQQESFGPLLIVQQAQDWQEAIGLVNGVPQGLAAALFSRSGDIAGRFLEEAETGILKLNRSTADAELDVPFGGWKHSGIGPPEHGAFDRDFYTRPQTLYR